MIGDGANRFNAQIYNPMAEVEEMEDEGVHYLKSAGNPMTKNYVIPGDVDYNNYITRSRSQTDIAGNSHILQQRCR